MDSLEELSDLDDLKEVKNTKKDYTVKIQIISDIHLENFNQGSLDRFIEELLEQKIVLDHNNIALLGDIGYPQEARYQLFIERMAHNYDNVFLLAGNHEYYQSGLTHHVKTKSMDQINEMIKKIADSFDNVWFMDNLGVAIIPRRSSDGNARDSVIPLTEFYKLDKFPKHYGILLGTTLWSEIPTRHRKRVVSRINDYRLIKMSNRLGSKLRNFTPDDSNELHAKSVHWLRTELERNYPRQKPLAVLSHHSPSTKKTSAPKYRTQDTNCAFATNMDPLFEWGVQTWAFGHTHWQTDHHRKGVRLISNPVGYRNELRLQHQKFNHDLCIILKC